MTDQQWRQLLERVEHQVTVPDLDKLQRRGVRLRRIRIAAGAAAVAAAVAVGAAVATTSVTDQDSVPHPVDRYDQDPPQLPSGRPGLFTFPPVGAAPSTPEHGELVAWWVSDITNYSHYLYADGRLIWSRVGFAPAEATGWVEQRLTPEGVDLMRTDARRNSAWLPDNAWEDRELKTYVPSRYAAWLTGAAPSEIGLLPAPAKELLWRDARPCRQPLNDELTCLTTDEARAAAEALDDSDFWKPTEPDGLYYEPATRDGTSRAGMYIRFLPFLPHGVLVPSAG